MYNADYEEFVALYVVEDQIRIDLRGSYGHPAHLFLARSEGT